MERFFIHFHHFPSEVPLSRVSHEISDNSLSKETSCIVFRERFFVTSNLKHSIVTKLVEVYVKMKIVVKYTLRLHMREPLVSIISVSAVKHIISTTISHSFNIYAPLNGNN